MRISRDKFGQQIGEWDERDHQLLDILEEVSSPDVEGHHPEKSLAAYMADIKELLYA